MAAITLVDARSAELIVRDKMVSGETGSNTSASYAGSGTKGRIKGFTFNTTDDLNGHTLVANDVVALTVLEVGDVLVGFTFANEAMGASIVADFGLVAVDGSGVIDDSATADTADFLLDGINVSAAAEQALTQVWADPDMGPYKVTKRCYLTLKMSGGTPAASKDVVGYALLAE